MKIVSDIKNRRIMYSSNAARNLQDIAYNSAIEGDSNINMTDHELTFNLYCQHYFSSILHHKGIASKALDVFKESPIGTEGWALVDTFCNQSPPLTIHGECSMPLHTLTEMNYLSIPVNGYILPCLGLLTIVTNILVCVVLLKKHMRNSTNILLVAMAISDLLTGAFPIPVFIHTYTLGYYQEWVTCTWAIVTRYLSLHIPTMCHTASIWLTVALAVERYLCVYHSLKAKQWCSVCNILKVIVIIYIMAFLAQLIRIFESKYEYVNVPSIIEPWHYVSGCYESNTHFFSQHEEIYYQMYWWFRVIFVHMVPCTTLVIVNMLLICTMRAAQKRRQQLLKQSRNTESRRLKETNSTTFMLVAVVGLFLLVEFPLAILLILYILQSSFYSHVFQLTEVFHLATLIINMCILLSYPFNFVIYCGMSKQFRDTFMKIFTSDNAALIDSQYLPLTELGNNKTSNTTDRMRTGSGLTDLVF